MAKRKSTGNYMCMTYTATVTRNGKTTSKNVNYERIEHPDGRVEERGRPPGLPKGASLADIIEHTLLGDDAEKGEG